LLIQHLHLVFQKKQISNGIVDSFVHIYEQYIGHYNKNPITDGFCEHLMRTLIKITPQLLNEPTNYEIRMEFCYIATLALNYSLSIGTDDCWASHMIGHQLTAFYGLDHGDTLSMSTPAVMKYEINNYGDKMKQMAINVFGIQNATPEDAINEVIKYFKSVGYSDKLKDRNISKERLKECSKWFIGKRCGAKKDIDEVAAAKIYEILYE